MAKKALIAGGAGFIGSHLCDLLLEKGYHVTAVDSLVTGREQNIAHIKSDNFRFIKHDIQEELPIKESFDEIYNLASPASPADFEKMPVYILMTASEGHKNLLKYAREHGGRLLFASTSEVYGDPEVHPQVESYFGNVNTMGPRACYDEAKRFGETLTMAYHREYGVETRIVRIFNTYGPRMRWDDGRIIPNFFLQGIKNQPLTIYGDGTQTRSYCYVSDNVKGLYALMQSDEVFPINIGAQNERTVLEMAEIIKKLTDNTVEITFHPLPENDPKQRRPDTTRAKEILNWDAIVSLEDGLQETFEYFKKNIQ